MKQPRVGGLDALRGLATVAVFVCHFAAYWPGIGLPRQVISATHVGAHGVDVHWVALAFATVVVLLHRLGGTIQP
ncbi:hypothetical protein [Microbacterium sp. SD291]|uniref:hypothetical protein n=1 Tax=Microbacterium sp. SD291 TaxID=2782007 RepID=UPI001A96C8AB|nr:hypothetical protein [Microbacterium sp. SD291]MBO0980973.1 hypothetical protein [Microbacterium sp. SD291]